jgi:hypothetical protein
MPTDTTEKGLETLIMQHMAQRAGCSRARISDPAFDEDKTELEEVEG